MKRRNRNQALAILLVSLVMVVVIATGTSIAYMFTKTSDTTNKFTPADVSIEIEEDFTNNTKSNVYFTNKSNIEVYIRATAVEYWTDPDGNIVPKPDECSVNGIAIHDTTNWFQVGSVYYYKKPVAAKNDSDTDVTDQTTILFEQVTVTIPSKYAGYSFHLDIQTEAIQANPKDAVEQSWTAVDVGTDGNLTPASATN